MTVRPLLPRWTAPDLHDGAAWVGVIGFRMTDLRLGGVPYPSFLELNVRTYSVDRTGRRAVVFQAMEASAPLFAAASRSLLRLPYTWSEMRFSRGDAGEIGYATRRRYPGPASVGVEMTVRPCGPAGPSALATALTARWALHQRWYGRLLHLPVDHPPWRLHEADLVTWRDNGLLASCGLPAMRRSPDSVLYASATTARFGLG